MAISIVCVREIVDYGVVTRVPRMPAFIRGVTNLRGTIVPVVDLALRLGSHARATRVDLLPAEPEPEALPEPEPEAAG